MDYFIAVVVVVGFALFLRNRIRTARKNQSTGANSGGSRPGSRPNVRKK